MDCGADDWSCKLRACQLQGNDQSCFDDVASQEQQYYQSGGAAACQAWDTDCQLRQQLQQQANGGGGGTMYRPLVQPSSGGPWNLFSLVVALVLLVGLPFLIVGISLKWSFNKWPSKRTSKDHA